MKIKYTIYGVFIIIFVAQLYNGALKAQQALHKYQISIQSDKRSYLTDEQIWCSIRVTDSLQGKLVDMGPIIYVALLDEAGTRLVQVKMELQDGHASGYMPLSSTMVSGKYLLTAFLRTPTINLTWQPILVINPNRPPPPVKNQDAENLPVNPVASVPDAALISVNKSQYGKREKISIEIDLQEQIASNLDVSIYRMDPLEAFADSLFAYQGVSLTGFLTDENSPGPEWEGHLIKARVFPENGTKPASKVRVYVTAIGQEATIATGISDDSGYVQFLLPLIYAEAQLVFTPLHKGDVGYRIEFDQGPAGVLQLGKMTPLNLKEYLAGAIRERNIEAETQKLFRPEEKFRYVFNNPDTTDFYGSPDKRYMLDDYTRFPNMEEILTEFVTEVRLRKNRDMVELQVNNLPYNKFFEEQALVLIDGVPITDMKQLLSLDPLQLKSIDVVSRKFFLGPVSFPGIIHYKSYKADLAGFILPSDAAVYSFEGIQLEKEYITPSYDSISDLHIPDYRNLLFWSPAMVTDSKGKIRFSCYSGDLPGIYLISVNGISSGGTLISAKKEIEIK